MTDAETDCPQPRIKMPISRDTRKMAFVMGDKAIEILLVEDNPNDLELTSIVSRGTK